MSYEHYYQQFLATNLYPRQLKTFSPEKKIINFSSSDYLGLAKHPLLISRSQTYAKQWGVGSSSSRLVTGNLSLYDELETSLAAALGKPAALILGAGYQTNISVLEALLDKHVLMQEPLVFCDKLCHISMMTMTRYVSRIQRFRHNDLSHLQQLLEKYSDQPQPKFILVESVYSMEGDQADLAQLIALAKHYHAFLYVDDAHAVGLYGEAGWGKATEYASDIPLIMGTFSKALGSFGGYIGCSNELRNYLVNKCKGLIYSTGLPPTVLGAISAVIDVLPQLKEERLRVMNHARKLRQCLDQYGLNYGNSTTHIVPWIIGDAKYTHRAAQLLEDRGILGVAIQPPSVPPQQSRIRFCLSAAHSDEDIDFLTQAIQKVAELL